MGNGHNDHFQYQQNLKNLQKYTFLPMLCSRTPIKDVIIPRLQDRSASFSDDPLSPKISCMGQVKRNNKIIGFPAATTHTNNKLAAALTSKSSSSSNDGKYFKLKRLFSAKNIATNNNNNNNNNNNVSSCRRRREVNAQREVSVINIAEMDPPLPVIKRVPKPAADLWKRRSNGGALKILELQHIEIPRHQVEIQTV